MHCFGRADAAFGEMMDVLGNLLLVHLQTVATSELLRLDCGMHWHHKFSLSWHRNESVCRGNGALIRTAYHFGGILGVDFSISATSPRTRVENKSNDPLSEELACGEICC